MTYPKRENLTPEQIPVYANYNEAMMAYQTGHITLQHPIRVRVSRTFEGQSALRIIDCTLGMMIFNEVIPQDIGRKPRTNLEEMFPLEVDVLCGKKDLGKIVDQVYQKHGIHETALVLDAIKALGFKYSTRGAVTVSVSDIVVPPQKPEMLAEADKQVTEINSLYNQGMLSEEERY
jgi:DNA-directed RNA polymerase subunit beta'